MNLFAGFYRDDAMPLSDRIHRAAATVLAALGLLAAAGCDPRLRASCSQAFPPKPMRDRFGALK